jgi:hypothetical protein
MGRNKNLAFEDKKEFFSRNDFRTAKSCKYHVDPCRQEINKSNNTSGNT